MEERDENCRRGESEAQTVKVKKERKYLKVNKCENKARGRERKYRLTKKT